MIHRYTFPRRRGFWEEGGSGFRDWAAAAIFSQQRFAGRQDLAPSANWARQRRVLTPFVFRRREGQVVLPEPGRSESLRETNCCDSQSLRDDFLGGRVPWRLGVGEHSGVGEHNARSSSICLLIASVPVPGALFSPVEFPIIHPLRPDKRLIDHTTATCAACPH